MMWGPYAGQAPLWMGWWMLVPLALLLALLAVGVWALARLTQRTGARDTATPTVRGEAAADDILRRRYASGEIDARTFEEMRARLAEPAGSAPTRP